MKKISLFIASCAVLVGALMPMSLAGAATTDVFSNNPGCTKGTGSDICGTNGDGLFSVIKSVIQVLLVIGGIIAVIMIILGGIRYMTSNGDQADVKAAKDTILYSMIGLVVTLLAFALVAWLMGNVK